VKKDNATLENLGGSVDIIALILERKSKLQLKTVWIVTI
jgi:hypothetical protein